jgi:ribonuclease BN (tRNA processing enzyme)
MKLTVIGSAGTFPGPASGCSSYLLEEDGFRMLLDVGNGSTGALQEACGLLGPDAVVVSHLHGDHYLDLVTYTYARRYHPDGAAPVLPVYGPSKIHDAMLRAYGKGIDSLLDEVYEFHPVDHDQVVGIGPFEVDLRRVNHPVETYGMRISAGGRTITYSADSGLCQSLVDLAQGVDLFLCEASYLDGEDNPPNIHLTGREAAQNAVRAEAQRLLLTHLVPWGDEARTVAEAKDAYDGEITVARSLDVHEV